jgi:hypothetical protein
VADSSGNAGSKKKATARPNPANRWTPSVSEKFIMR